MPLKRQSLLWICPLPNPSVRLYRIAHFCARLYSYDVKIASVGLSSTRLSIASCRHAMTSCVQEAACLPCR